MKTKIKILIRPARIRKRSVWLLYFRYNEYLAAKIKLKYKAQWCAELKCWWIDYQVAFIQDLKLWNEIQVLQSQHLYLSNSAVLENKNYYRKKRFFKLNLDQ